MVYSHKLDKFWQHQPIIYDLNLKPKFLESEIEVGIRY